MQTTSLADYAAEHFLWDCDQGVATITLNRPERKNPLTFESYAELRDLFRSLVYADDVHAVIIKGAGGNFCSGGDVHEIIGPLTKMNMKELMAFTRMTGDLVKAMRACRQPVISAVEGVCAGAGAIIAMPVTYAMPGRRRKSLFCSTAWAWRVVTWAPVPSCPESSARDGPASCFILAGPWAPRRGNAGGSSTA